jgi:uncharacterized membrane protein required for colicin V production
MSLVVLGLLGYSGWRRGLLLMGLSLVGLATAYGSAYLLYRPVGRVIGDLLSLQPILAYPLGGIAVFLLVIIAFFVVGRLVKRRLRRRRLRKIVEGRRSLRWADRAGGALLGAAYGGVLVLLIAWALLLLRTLAPDSVPDVQDSFTGRLAKPLVERFAYAVTHHTSESPALADAASRFAASPARSSEDLKALARDKRFQSLFGDPSSLSALADPSGRAAARDPTLRRLARDPAFVDRAGRLGLLETDSADRLSAPEVQRQLAERLGPMARAIRDLSRDPEVRRLMKDPELASRLERREMLALANDPKFNRLAEIVLERLRAQAPRKEDGAEGRHPVEPEEGRIYRWKDKRGRWHFSDRPPPDARLQQGRSR